MGAAKNSKYTAPVLVRYEGNPLLRPISNHPWESKAVFNPAAVYLDGCVHIIYRAIGDLDISSLGYAVSNDGFNISERLSRPVYVPRETFEGTAFPQSEPVDYTGLYTSGGGGYGGCEDPRITKIEDTIYMTYVAYDGCSPPRVALTSISVEAFLKRRWIWKKPVLISRPGITNKNACIFPEKIGGKFVIFHRVFPDICIDILENLDFDGESKWLETKYCIQPRQYFWDNRKVGAGATPIRTDKGWLLIYQAVDALDSCYFYNIGAMLLDINNPARVLARSKSPALSPQAEYELEGLKPGVVYPCGAVVINKVLFVYYGAADEFTCVAAAELNEFLDRLLHN
jgi:predicted GH43/DUF377 family glycosyl hydrolase